LIDFGCGQVVGSPDGFIRGDKPRLYVDPENGRAAPPICKAPELTFEKDYSYPSDIFMVGLVFTTMSDKNRKFCVEFPGTKFEDMQCSPFSFRETYVEIFKENMTPIPPPAEYGEDYSKLILSMVDYDLTKRPTS
jgi:serine/threonine protein kinase